LLARAVAHHTNCTFIRVSGFILFYYFSFVEILSSELVQKYIGEGARMVRELFVMARQHAPSIIFMDEIDSIGGVRTESKSGGDSGVLSNNALLSFLFLFFFFFFFGLLMLFWKYIVLY
jgi:26S proteasome regulatory subunit T6